MAKLTSNGIRFATADEINTRRWMFQGPNDPNGSPPTIWIFYQANAPTGWTKLISQDNTALRVVSGGSGGSSFGTNGFTSIMNSTGVNYAGGFGGTSSVNGMNLLTNMLPAHNHPMDIGSGSSYKLAANDAETFPDGSFKQWKGGDVNRPNPGQAGQWERTFPSTGDEGGTTTHDHTISMSIYINNPISLAVRYIDVILCNFNG